MNEYENKVANGFNKDNIGTDFMIEKKFNGWKHITDKETQRTKGDITNGKTYIDFKFDSYDNKNIVIEVKQLCGYGWLDELDDETYIMWIKCANGFCALAKVKNIKDFVKTPLFAIRKVTGAWSKTSFKNFSFEECEKYIKGFTYINVANEEWWKDLPEILKEVKKDKINLYENRWFSEVKRVYKDLTIEDYENITGLTVSQLERDEWGL